MAHHTTVVSPSRSIHNPAISRFSIRTGLLVLVVSVHPAIGKDGKLKGGRLLGVARGIVPMDLVEVLEFVRIATCGTGGPCWGLLCEVFGGGLGEFEGAGAHLTSEALGEVLATLLAFLESK